MPAHARQRRRGSSAPWRGRARGVLRRAARAAPPRREWRSPPAPSRCACVPRFGVRHLSGGSAAPRARARLLGGAHEVAPRRLARFRARAAMRRRPCRLASSSMPCRSSCTSARTLATSRYLTGSVELELERSRRVSARRARRNHQRDAGLSAHEHAHRLGAAGDEPRPRRWLVLADGREGRGRRGRRPRRRPAAVGASPRGSAP